MINNQIRREEFDKRRNYKGNQSFCEGYECPIFQNCLVEINQFKNEKQQLINFLKDKINYYGIFTTTSKALQGVLAFVNKGGKDE